MYGFGWRQYMPDIGRWNGMDQLSEMYAPISPYAYVANNPVSLMDPDGRKVVKEGEGSWTFSGASIQGLWDYLVFGGDFGDLTKGLENTDFGSDPVNHFWSNFQGGTWDNPIILNEAVIKGKKVDKSNVWDGAYDYVLSPENIDDYLKMRQAMHEGQMGVVIFYGSVVALPYMITWGSLAVNSSQFLAIKTAASTVIQEHGLEVSLRFAADVGAQAAFNNGEVNYFSAAAGAMTPWYLSGAASEATQLTQNSLKTGRLPDPQAFTSSLLKSTMVAPMGSMIGGIMRNQGANAVATEATEAVINEMGSRTMDNKVQQYIK